MKLVNFDSKQEMDKPLDMIKGGGAPVGPKLTEHNLAAVNTGRTYPKSGNGLPPSPAMKALPDDVRGDTLKPLNI